MLQFNKRDMPNILSTDQLARELRVKGEPLVEAVAGKGEGVFETLREVAKLVLAETEKGHVVPHCMRIATTPCFVTPCFATPVFRDPPRVPRPHPCFVTPRVS